MSVPFVRLTLSFAQGRVAIVPIADKGATWDAFVAWQRGKTALPVRALINSLG